MKAGAGVVLVLTLLVTGCGQQPMAAPAGAIEDHELAAPSRTTVLFIDGSPSFRRYAVDSRRELTAVMNTVASRRGRVVASVTDGQPLTTARIISADFTETPASGSDPAIRRRFNQATALGFTRRLGLLLRRPSSVSGSGQLEALALASEIPSLKAVVFWTDAAVNQPDGLNVTRASNARIDREVQRWAPRLGALRGRVVVLLGVGRGIHRSATVMRAKRLFVGLAEAVGFRLYWAQSLAQVRG